MTEDTNTAVAVVGLACRFPGAPDAEAFWDLLARGREGLTRFTDAELETRGVPAGLRRHPHYVPVGGVIAGQDEFDPAPFGLTDADAALLDPQQRLLLECSWHAMEDAGHGGGRGLGEVGVYTGSAPSAYLSVNLADRVDHTGGTDPMGSLQATMGSVADYLPLQVAYRMDLTGPAMAVQATCATSLVAVHLAARSLLLGECDAALAGGVSLIVPQGQGYLHVPDGILSADGRTCSFGAEASGIVHTQGVGVVVLRRLDDALAAGDPVRAVIRGTAVNNDGAAKIGFTAPSLRGQARAIAEAHAAAGVTPGSIGLVEAHGTATAIGDQIELEALTGAFGRSDAPWCGLGSVKSNIGHANTAAGVASLIKTVLALERGTQPATLHADPASPRLSLHESPFELVCRTRPWPELEGTRRAGVSAFGIGGTNCHVVVEQAPSASPTSPDGRPHLILVSAATEAACRAGLDRAGTVLGRGDPERANIAHTLHAGRAALGVRAAAVLTDGDTPAEVLSAAPVRAVPGQPPRLVLAFPGAGAQHAGMGAGLYRDEPAFAATVDECAAALRPLLGVDIRDIVTAARDDPRAVTLARDVRYGQPALFAVSLAAARTLASFDVHPDAVLGHSLGEYTAAVLAGVLTLADAARLVAVRSLGVAESAPGGMLAVQLGADTVAARLVGHTELDLAAVNAPDVCVVAGPDTALDRFAAELAAEGTEARRLEVDVALHSRAVDPVGPRLRDAAAGLVPGPPTVPLFSTRTGSLATADELTDPEHWVRHLREPVRFSEALRAAVGSGPTALVQAGPGSALATLARRHDFPQLAQAASAFPPPDDPTEDRVALLDAVGRLWCAGIEPDPAALHRGDRRRVRLAGYAFQRRRLWIDPPDRPAEPAHPLDPATEFQVPVWWEVPPPAAPARTLSGTRWLVAPGTGVSAGARDVADAVRAAGGGAEPLAGTGDPAPAGPFTGVVLLVGPSDDGGPLDADRVDAAITSAAAVARTCERLGEPERPTHLLAVTWGAECLPGDGPTDPVAAAARALPRVLGDETGLRWRAVDLAAGTVDPAAVVAEAGELLAAGDGEAGIEVVHRHGGRWERGWSRWRPDPERCASGTSVGDATGPLTADGEVDRGVGHREGGGWQGGWSTCRPGPGAAVSAADVNGKGSGPLPTGDEVEAVTRRDDGGGERGASRCRPAPGPVEPGARMAGADTGQRRGADDRAAVPGDPSAVVVGAPAPAGGPAGAEAVHRDGGCLQGAQSLSVPAAPGGDTARTALVLGGLGRVGLLLAEHLAHRHGARVVLASRSVDGPAHERVAHLGERGLEVTARAVDVTDPAAVRGLLDDVATVHGPADLVVHAAGTVGAGAVAPLGEPPAPGCRGNVAAKVAGTAALHEAVELLAPERRPRLVVLMSSVAGVAGGIGLGEYATANRYLEAWARDRAVEGAARRPRWLAVAWDTWAGDERAVGALAPAAQRAVPVPAALEAFDRLVGLAGAGQGPPVVAVSPSPLGRSARVAGTPPSAAARAGADPAPASAPTLRSDPAVPPFTTGEAAVAEVWTEMLGTPVTRRDNDFFAMGGHSLLATRMLARLRDRYGAEVRLRDLVARPTVAGLAAVLGDPPDEGVPAPAAPTPAAAPDGPFPLTRVQHAYWVGRTGAFGLGDVACHFYLEYDCPDLDLDRYERAWNRVIDRHAMLRAVITEDGRNRVLPEVPEFRVRRHDLRDLPDDERDTRLAGLRRHLSHRVPRPDRWPLFDVRAALLDGGRVRLFVGVDALICDTASYFLLDGELRHLYADPDASLAPIRSGFADYVADAAARRDSAEHARAVEYWRDRRDLPGPPNLPVRERAQARPWFGRRRDEVDPQRWDALRAAATRHGVTPSAVLLTAYADVLAAWSGDQRFGLTLTFFDRPSDLPDIDRVVGDFTSLLLHEVDRRCARDFAERVGDTQRRLFDDLDHRGHSALEVLAERSAASGRRHTAPVVFTSALGVDQVTGAEPDLEWAGHIVHGVSQTPQVWLDHQVYTQAGALHLQWDVLETAIGADAADDAFAAYVAWLRRLADVPDAWSDTADGPRVGGTTVEEVAARLAGVWADVLEVPAERIGHESTFVALGGDSVLAVRMAAAVRDRLGVSVPVAELIGDRPLATLARQVAERLSGPSAPRSSATELRRRADPTTPFPLTPLQQAYWVGQQGGWALSYDSAYLYVDFRLGGVEAADVPGAVRRLVERQPMLRATFLPDGTQRVLPVDDPALPALPVTELDLSGETTEAADNAVADIRDELQRTGPAAPPWPFSVTACRLPDGELRLHLVCSLLVADGWSFQLMFTELFTYLDEPNAVLPPLSAGFDDYVETVERLRNGDDWAAQRDWWWSRLDELPAAPALPLAASLDDARPRAMTRREFRVAADRVAVLRQRCAEHGITPSTLFATCYAMALARRAGHRRFLLNVLYLNRPAELDHAMGPYAATVLLDVDLPLEATFDAACHRLQDGLAQVLDRGEVTGVEVARELARRRGDRAPQAPVVFHSTLGLRPPMSTPPGVEVRDFLQRVRTPQVALDLQVFEWDWDDDVVVNLDAVAEVFAPETLDTLVADIDAAVAALVDDPNSWTAPVDLPDRHTATPPAVPASDTPDDAPGPPETAAERSVAALWAELLGTDPQATDRTADFFALGGDSVVAVRMLGRVGREHGTAVAPREFLRHPTVAGLAALLPAAPALPAAGTRERDDGDVAVRLRDGTGAPLFLIHPTGGDVLCYLDLARELRTDRPVVGLQDPGLAGAPGPDSVPALAREYAAVLRAWQPEGPYLIGGWSMGGIVAHELARALRADHAEVGVLAMIDSNVADRIVDVDRGDFWLRYLGSLEAFLDVDLGCGTESGRDALTALPQDAQVGEAARRLVDAGLLRGTDDPALGLRTEVFRRHMRALAGHRTGSLQLRPAGEAVLIRAERTASRNSGVDMGVDDATDLADLGWDAHLDAAVTVRGVQADHYALLRPPAARAVAEALSDALARAGRAEGPTERRDR